MSSNDSRSAGLAPKPARRRRCSIPVRPRAMAFCLPEEATDHTAISGERAAKIRAKPTRFPLRCANHTHEHTPEGPHPGETVQTITGLQANQTAKHTSD